MLFIGFCLFSLLCFARLVVIGARRVRGREGRKEGRKGQVTEDEQRKPE